jgi:hypothetical protein
LRNKLKFIIIATNIGYLYSIYGSNCKRFYVKTGQLRPETAAKAGLFKNFAKSIEINTFLLYNDNSILCAKTNKYIISYHYTA